ncbi:hypothetical protein AC062_0976 [Pasteurellaceae bacterium NI1060]|nr:hypothetical protein AC062_0976 [Pasteurellaceae bacterium NI1060]
MQQLFAAFAHLIIFTHQAKYFTGFDVYQSSKRLKNMQVFLVFINLRIVKHIILY